MDDFDKVMEFIFKWEGGYVNDPVDPGGETNFGIAKRSHPDVDIKNLTKDQAKEIYRNEYWAKLFKFYSTEETVLPALMNAAVNMGVGEALALEIAQGEFEAYVARTRAHYFEIIAANPAMAKYAHGWNNRLVDLEKTFN